MPTPKPTLPVSVTLALILLSVGLATSAQITLKHAMNRVAAKTGPLKISRTGVRTVVTTPSVWMGLGFFALSAVAWLVVLSVATLSFAYPFVSLTYVVIIFYDRFRGVMVGGRRWVGVALIVAGVVLVTATADSALNS